MILAAMIIARNPAQYGFELDAAEPGAPETVTINGPVDLRRIAEWTARRWMSSSSSTPNCGVGRPRFAAPAMT